MFYSNSQQKEAMAPQHVEGLSGVLEKKPIGIEPADSLSPEHKAYLLKVHGTIDLDPIPSMDPEDPLNWPPWKKHVNLALVSSLSLMATFIAAGIIPAFQIMAKDLHEPLQSISYLTSSQIAMHGVAPLFWKPLSNRHGRRPVWLLSALGGLAFNIGCAKSSTFGSMMTCRVLTTFFISPAVGIGSAVVTETFFAKERGFKMGLWTLPTTLGPPMGPLLMGFVAYHTDSWRWIYWIFAMINGGQSILIFFLSPETRYIRTHEQADKSSFIKKYTMFGKIHGTVPIKFRDFYVAMELFAYPSIMVPTLACSIIFGFASVLMTVEIPSIFGTKFDFNPQQIGLQFLGLVIGSVLGEQVGGPLSDFFMNSRARKIGRLPPPEYRIWSSYVGFVCAIIGFIVFGVQLQNTPNLDWNVTPLVGVAFAAFGNQVITTALVTYSIDSHPEHSASIGVFFNFVRSTWGFIGPFWFPKMLRSLGYAGSGGLMAGLTLVGSVVPVIFLHWKGSWFRKVEDKEEILGLSHVATSRV